MLPNQTNSILSALLGSLILIGCCASPTRTLADDISPDLRSDILPILKQRCALCHGPRKQEGGLNLALPQGVARGGENGPAVVAGDPDASLLWQKILAGEMPPDEPLPDDERSQIGQWLHSGAIGLPQDVPPQADGDEHWAFQRLQHVQLPSVAAATVIRTPIDLFIQSQLEKRGLAIGPETDRTTLIRRVSFDLIGLPPSPDEIREFSEDTSQHAYERMVERYLASPQYGERWGKYWLDAAGYADSNGYFNADTDRPLAYRYRDYVIRSLQGDRPWDEFIRQQLAGDELVGFVADKPVTPDMVDGLEAVHFLRNSPDGTDSSDGNPDELRADRYAVLEGTLQIIGSSLLGLTVQCARCHDHKFEPLTQREYYQLQAVLYPAFHVENWIPPAQRETTTATAAELVAWQQATDRIDAQIAAIRSEAAEDVGKTSTSEGQGSVPGETSGECERRIRELEAQKPEKPGRLALVADYSADLPRVRLLIRGDYRNPGDAVDARVPEFLCDVADRALCDRAVDKPDGSTGRRLALANWLTRPDSRAASLLARVTVNRWWQHHFGTGIVATPDNLGYSASAASDPRLLEYLAGLLIRQGWSAKAVHRLILCSAVYRQTSVPSTDAARIDPDNRWLSRFPLRRLDAEALRDGLLCASGELDTTRFGPYVPTSRSEQGEVVVSPEVRGARRRSIYLQQRRTQVADLLDVFDAPSLVTSCTRRASTTVPLQSLKLLNADFVRRRADGVARRVLQSELFGDEPRVRYAALICWGREPTSTELAAALDFLRQQPGEYLDRENVTHQVWTDFCQMLLASNAFLYVE